MRRYGSYPLACRSELPPLPPPSPTCLLAWLSPHCPNLRHLSPFPPPSPPSDDAHGLLLRAGVALGAGALGGAAAAPRLAHLQVGAGGALKGGGGGRFFSDFVFIHDVLRDYNMTLLCLPSRAVLPIGALYAGTLWLGNAAYLHITVAFIQVYIITSYIITLRICIVVCVL